MNFAEKRKKILIVDDEKDMVDLLQIELEKEDYNVISAYDGENGLDKYLNEKPDLIILDVMMPKMTGHGFCRKIRREFDDNHTPILMLTALSEDSDRIIGRVIGAEKYITKPFDIENLLKEVEELLSQRK